MPQDTVTQQDIDRATFPKRFAEEINLVLDTLNTKDTSLQQLVVGMWLNIRYQDPKAPR